jgi:hypothetical protein
MRYVYHVGKAVVVGNSLKIVRKCEGSEISPHQIADDKPLHRKENTSWRVKEQEIRTGPNV